MSRLSVLAATVATCMAACGRAELDEPLHFYGPPPASAAEPQSSAEADEREDSEAKTPPSLWTRTQGVDWPAFLGPDGDSKSTETGIRVEWGETGPPLVWHRRVATGYGMPSVSRGRLFLFDREGDRARVTCLNAETGASLWEFDYPTDYEDLYNYNNGPRCSPVVDGDRVYTFGVEGMLHCLSAVDGKMLWSVDTAKQFGVVQNFFGVGSTPVIEGDLLIVQVGGSPPDDQKVAPGRLDLVHSNGTAAVAFDKYTGEVRYKTGDDLASYAGPKVATINGRRNCLLFARSGLLAFDPSNGEVGFEFPWRAPILESVNASNPIVTGDRVFISETYGPGAALLRVMEDGGCEVLWSDAERRRDKRMQTHWNTPILHEGYVYGSSGRHSNNAELRCIDLETGEVAWSEPGLSRCSLLYVDGHFVVLSEYGELMLIRATPEKFDPVARVTLVDEKLAGGVPGLGPPALLKYPCWAAPILSHGLLYVRGEQRLVCLELIPQP